jgi:REP element-mobilizing transposase RayT
MARPLRIDVEDGLYHVTSRGWERRVVVRDDRDRQRWLDLLDRIAARSGWRVFSWVLMSNHFHLYLRTPQANLSAGMHDLNSGYVHLNPVRAGIVKRPQQHPWSSYQHYLDGRKTSQWLDRRTILGELGGTPSRARAAYRRFVEAGLQTPPASPLAALVGGMFLGSSPWIERRRLAEEPVRQDVPAQRQLAWRPSIEHVVAAVSHAFDVEPNEGVREPASRQPGAIGGDLPGTSFDR